MQKKQIAFKTKGMNRDLSVSAFSPEFAFENINLRLSTNDDNTSMSWVNEKGTAAITTIYQEASDGSATSTPTQLSGTPVGKAEINHYLVVFTHASEYDHIYRLKYSNADKTEMSCCTLYTGHLGFDNNHPLETLVSYEAEDIQKVYWTDGKNQPRLINIMADPNTAHYNDTAFDFIPTLRLRETVTVQKQLNKFGEFPSGVIQYAFTYYRKYGQESNIFYTSPLLYISPKDRGASPEEKVANAFQIDIDNADTNFDYVRIYSIIRTSLNATPYVRRVQDLEITSNAENTVEQEVSYAAMPKVSLTGSEPFVDIPVDDMQKYENYWGRWVCYYYEDYPNLVLKTSDGYVTWGPNSGGDACMFIRLFKRTPEAPDPTAEHKILVQSEFDEFIIDDPDEQFDYGHALEPLTFYIETTPHISFLDTGDVGESVDPTELLYKGGETIHAQTLEQKDNTLFFGNISQGREEVLDDIDLTGNISIGNSNRRIYTDLIASDSIYPYANQLTAFSQNNGVIASTPCGGFKRGDFYRLGVQFQHETGRWSDPIFIGDSQIADDNYPSTGTSYDIDTGETHSYIKLPIFTVTIDRNQVNAILAKHYLKARPVVVFPDFNDRVVVCQGVINPTLYTEKHRSTDKDLYAQSSWFFRPRLADGTSIINGVTVSPHFSLLRTLPYTNNKIGKTNEHDEVVETGYNPANIRSVEIQGEYTTSTDDPEIIDDTEMFRLYSLVETLHSPDIVFANSIRQAHLEGVKYRILGKINFKKTLSDILIELESPAAASSAGGFIHKSFEKNGSYGIVSGLFFEDWVIDEIDGKDPAIIEKWRDEKSPVKWLVYPWQRTGSLNNDIQRPGGSGVRSAVLKRKVISNLRIADTIYDTSGVVKDLSGTPKVFSADYVDIIKIGSDEDHIYEGNIDTAVVPKRMDGLYFAFDGETHTGIGNSDLRKSNIPTSFESTKWWKTFNKDSNIANERTGLYYYDTVQQIWPREENLIGDEYIDLVLAKSPVRITYKSTPHMVLEFNSITPPTPSAGESILPIIEIVRPGDRGDGYRHTMFGGTSEDALKSNRWIPCGEPVRLVNGSDCEIKYEYGDTYFQRWDCLKTYAFTREDFNQIVEIGSFMLESHVNCDGRYDRNRGQKNNTHMSPENFNLLNDVYTQQNNFFSYRIHDKDTYKRKYFPNQITWTKTKKLGDVVDMWTSLTLASVLELDGDKGSVTSLQRLNDQLICFQDKGFSQILYNENVQLSSTQGVPIELANSGKVQGFRYYNNSVGCSNKWSISNTPSGIYFMDSNDKSIFLFNGQLSNLSLKGGLNTWCKKNIPDSTVKWTPDAFSNFIAHYDTLNQDVLFVNSDNALAFSERVGTFTSFYSYGNTPFLCSLDDTAVWIKSNSTLHRHNAGNYCEFFGESKDFSLTLVGNPEYSLDKVFTNLEFRAIVDGEGSYDSQTGKFTPTLPFDSIEVWNEFQHGISGLSNMVGHSDMQHYVGANSSLKRKFRIWRCDIPRDNYTYSDISTERTKQIEREHSMGIYRNKVRPIDRMRNNWIYLNLKKSCNTKVEIHDVVMTYYT